ncbi:unnamed protein product [Heligmosomoides polygyrus]|uniref:Uncharacterized protein n=1 Tax=Heligmosomoides polygyrus TaxID=6339 RepID=A0A183FQ01_HELPZ|nr:unnamed protein product [Heligmosomoides polygyrus]
MALLQGHADSVGAERGANPGEHRRLEETPPVAAQHPAEHPAMTLRMPPEHISQPASPHGVIAVYRARIVEDVYIMDIWVLARTSRRRSPRRRRQFSSVLVWVFVS